MKTTIDYATLLDVAFEGKEFPHETIVREAVETIVAEKLNVIRCAVTGAPYATVNEEEVKLFCMNVMSAKPKSTADSIADDWSIAMIVRNQHASVALTGTHVYTLSNLAKSNSKDMLARLTVAYMGRFLFSFNDVNKSVLDAPIRRMTFNADWYDFIVSLSDSDAAILKTNVAQLAAADWFLRLDKWKDMPIFNRRATVNGIMSKQHELLRGWILNPETMPVTIQAVEYMQRQLLKLSAAAIMIEGGERPAIDLPNQDSGEVARLLSNSELALAPDAVTTLLGAGKVTGRINEVTPERQSQIDEAQRLMNERIAQENAKHKQAWSATHGKGYKPGEAPAPKPVVSESKLKTLKMSKAAYEAMINLDF